MLTDQEFRQAVVEGRVSLPPRPKPDPGCAYCHGRGVIRDPDGGVAEPCRCGVSRELADLFNDQWCHGLSEWRKAAAR